MLRTRVLTALLMVFLLYLATVYLSPFMFSIALAIVLIPALLEWSGLMGLHSRNEKMVYLLLFYGLLAVCGALLGLSPNAQTLSSEVVVIVMVVAFIFWLFAFYAVVRFPAAHDLWSGTLRIGLMGILCILPTWAGLVQLKYVANSGVLVLTLIALVSMVDIGAFFVGSAWGKSKLAPELSPKKSWAGFWGGLVSCILLSALFILLLHSLLYTLTGYWMGILLLLGLLIGVLGVVGDLYESMLKRHQGVKDSGKSLPGHGGILDRVDSLMAATPVFVLTIMYLLTDVPWY